ncbi:ADGRL2 [Branchiostoma lanceolatum]|uniref:ADGRL2 protein n=1 Tax=Branchiostoma lanceolatum TaxID=7740 RepID=A0A8K0ERP5_BRALA|nr:ADGRL2 [Branchiostoma lanceolatum]
MSLTLLFNFDVDENGEDSFNQCPSDTVFDPFVDTCRYFSSASRSHGSANKTIPLQNCSEPALTFTAEEFHVLPNGSVHLLSSNVSCPTEQVVILNTTASICGECILQYFSNDTQTANSQDPVQGWLTLGLVIASAVAVFCFVVHTVRSGQWKKVPEKLKVQMLTCMALAEVMFVVRLFVPPGPVCAAYAILLHYLFLTAFTSMNALAVDLFLTFRDGLERAAMYKYLLYTWLMPVPIVVMTVIVEFASSVRVGYGENCWIGNPIGSLLAFGLPVLCALLVNAVFVTIVLLTIRKSFQIADAALSRSNISKAWVYLRISFLAGFTWILGFIYPFVNSRVLDYIFIVLNASQGLLLTVALIMTSKVVQKWKSAIKERFGLGEPHQNNEATATANNRRAMAGGTEATAGGTASDIEMSTLADVENRARLHLAEVHHGNGAATTTNNQRAMAGGTEATTGGTATDIEMSTLANVENRARLHLIENHEVNEEAATTSDRQTNAYGTEATTDGTASDIEMSTLADVENRARLHPAEVHQDNEEAATANNRRAMAGGTEATAGGTATDIEMSTLADVENRARLHPAEVHQDNEEAATASARRTMAGGTETTAGGTGTATEVPTETLANVMENTSGDEEETRL